MPRRSYAQYCAVARGLDVVGERWTLLIVRELAFGPRRYTDLHADLPGISTDVLAARLKELEADGVVERRTFAPAAPVRVYDLTDRGRLLVPVVTALAAWGSPLLAAHQETDAVRHHWYLLPLAALVRDAAAGAGGVVELRVEGSSCRLQLASMTVVPDEAPDVVVTITPKIADELLAGRTTLAAAITDGQVLVEGSGPVADRLSR
ncbi:DNA-binding HxlR family transcriptional regulator [Kribbella aluminosa]|uniref:DNA-binding HxlR family transcriptional regulator n=1 Tax=Kribbella aluminosa TaxID=416017 RepID=A0ABS4UG51_9ACTN|nr:helix-turn-helix domain-containing protein [Kribbella aluminosa]MBP2350631.1 DNA-binding HxlR family transcriptional regulator [Kribbella aluminosa]